MINIRKILYATDFSSYSNQAYFHAVALADHHRATLSIVFVHTPGSQSMAGSSDADSQYWKAQLEQIRPVDGRIQVTHTMLSGEPATEIVNYAAANSINLIVMGTHGRTGLERLL